MFGIVGCIPSSLGVVSDAAAEELPPVHTRACGTAGICGVGQCVGTLLVDMLRTACVSVGSEGLLTLLS